MTRFDTVLVANRGEIALRVIRSAAAYGLRTVAVYSDADHEAPHVRAADEAVRIGPAPAADSYLSIPALLDAAKRSGADAVHPGYGFLSERSEFARAVTEAGLAFIGPPADVMAAMGRKDRARQIAIEAGVPVLPAADPLPLPDRPDSGGVVGATTPHDLSSVGLQIGFPLLVKAAAGGGGKGMRIVRAPGELTDAVEAARREALSAFGDDALLFEHYVEHGRHIEVQVLADEHGNVVHLFERDCSVQRRHQKVIEEAPASLVSAGVRELVQSSAVDLARRVGYVNAGTVEFLVSGDDAYFLEMNTRLQVEHAVTELVTDLDLVTLQLMVAQGLPLPFDQSDISPHGHAIEARVYAEDPFSGFLPQAGVARLVQWPRRARVDAALESGQRVGTHYDPLLGKVIVSGASREAARRALVNALDDTAILGVTTNAGFLRSLADSAAYREGEIDTAWLDSHPGRLSRLTPDVAWYLAAWALATDADGNAGAPGPLTARDGWRLSGSAAGIPVSLISSSPPPSPKSSAASPLPPSSSAAEQTRLLTVHPDAGVICVDGRDVAVGVVDRAGGRLRMEIDGQIEVGRVLVERHQVLAAYHGQTHVFGRPDAFEPTAGPDSHDGSIVAPMPATVLVVHVAPGSVVHEGDVLAVLEAMKMELALKAPFAGVVASVAASPGERVDLGALLFLVERESDGETGP